MTVVLGLILAMETLYLHAELVRKTGVENDTHEGRECQSGEVDGTDVYIVLSTIFHTNGNYQDQGSHKHIT